MPHKIVLTSNSDLNPYFSKDEVYQLKSNPDIKFNSAEELQNYIVNNPQYKISIELPSDQTAIYNKQEPPELPKTNQTNEQPTYTGKQAFIGPATSDYRTPQQKAYDQYINDHWQEIQDEKRGKEWSDKGANFLLSLISPTNWYGWINGGEFANNRGIFETNSDTKSFYQNYPLLATLINLGGDATISYGAIKGLKNIKPVKVYKASGLGNPYVSDAAYTSSNYAGLKMIQESERRLVELQQNMEQIISEGSNYIKIHGKNPEQWAQSTRSIRLDYNILNNPNYLNSSGNLTSSQIQNLINTKYNIKAPLYNTDIATSVKGKFYTAPYADAFPYPTADPLVYVTHEFAHYTNPKVPVNAPGFQSAVQSEEVLAIGSQIKSWLGKSKISVDDFKFAAKNMANALKENINLNNFFFTVSKKAAQDSDYITKLVKYINLFSRIIIPGAIYDTINNN